MEIRALEGGTILCHKEVGTVEERCGGGDQSELYRPVGETAVGSRGHPAGARSGTYERHCGGGVILYECGCFPLLDAYGTDGALRETGSETVAVFLADDGRFAAYHLYRTFGTRLGACAAAGALFPVDTDDLSHHGYP